MPKTNHSQARGSTSQLVLKAIYDHDAISRAEVARFTHLTPPTVSDAVAGLLTGGLVEEIGPGASTGGKRPTLLRVVDDSRHLIGLDLASGDFHGAIVNLRGAIQHRITLPLLDRGGDAALTLVYELVDALMAQTSRPLLGIGIGAPGLVDTANGVVCRAVNVDWVGLPLREILCARYGLPVHLANDCQLAAWAEYTANPGDAIRPLVVIKLGRGVGAGIVVNGQLLHGSPYGAGEIGHVVVEPGGERCQCGNHGCLETAVSSRAITRRVRALAQQSVHPQLRALAARPEAMTLDTVIGLHEAGDTAVAQVVAEAGRRLGIAAANLVGVLGPCRIRLAGSMRGFGDTLLDALREELSRRTIASLALETEIGWVSDGNDIVLRGASALVIAQEAGLL